MLRGGSGVDNLLGDDSLDGDNGHDDDGGALNPIAITFAQDGTAREEILEMEPADHGVTTAQVDIVPGRDSPS